MDPVFGSEALPPLLTVRKWAYRVEAIDHADNSAWTMLSWGTRPLTIPMADLATNVAQETRTGHSYYTGALRVSVWEWQESEHYLDPTPDGCSRFIYDEVS
jgi:hypothetical protein